MKLIRNPNAWSCTLASAAMAFDYNINDLKTLINHDGSEKVHPQLPSPACYKGFHIQEIVDVGVLLGFSMTYIEVLPAQTPNGIAEYIIEKWGLFPSGAKRFLHYLNGSCGLLIGKTKKWWHTCAYDHGIIYDPRGRVYPENACKIFAHSLWVVSKNQIIS